MTWFSKFVSEFIVSRAISNRKLVNARRRILMGAQAISPALVSVVNEQQLAVKDKDGIPMRQGLPGNHCQVSIYTGNGDREPRGKKPVTLLINEFLDELGEIPSLIPLRDFPTHPSLPENKSPINFNFQTNNKADLLTQKIQHLLRDIYTVYNSTAYYSLEIVQRAHWLNTSKKFEYAMRAKKEVENNYLRY